MEKQIYYFINYEKAITAVGECNPSYMKDRGYTLVDKATYENYINTNEEYLAKIKAMEEEIEK